MMNMNIGAFFGSLLGRLEEFMVRHRWAAFPYAVIKKFSDDQTGHFAALIAYYGFMSLFPLLLILVSLLEIFLRGNGHLRDQILNYATSEFPTLGQQLQTSLHGHGVSGSGIGLAIGIILTLIGARGVAIAISDSLNHLWRVPHDQRHGFPLSWVRQIAMMGVLGLSAIGTTALVAILGPWGVAPALAVNIVSFLGIFRLGTSSSISTGKLMDSAIIAAIFWQILQGFGTILVKDHLHRLSGVYGTFAVVLGLLWWVYIQAQVTLLAIEIHVVREFKLWPRSLTEPPLMEGDKAAYARYAKEERRRPEEDIDVDFRE